FGLTLLFFYTLRVRHTCSSFFFHAPPPTELFTLSLHDALPIWARLAELRALALALPPLRPPVRPKATAAGFLRSLPAPLSVANLDRKSTRLNSSHVKISYAVFCLKKKK